MVITRYRFNIHSNFWMALGLFLRIILIYASPIYLLPFIFVIYVNFTTPGIDIALHVNKHVSCGNVTISLHIITAFKRRVNVGQVGNWICAGNVPIIARILLCNRSSCERIIAYIRAAPMALVEPALRIFRFSPTIQNSLHISISNLKLIGFSPRSGKYIICSNTDRIWMQVNGQNKIIVNNAICDIPICNKYHFYLGLLTLQKFCANVELVHTYIFCILYVRCDISVFSIVEIVAMYFQECPYKYRYL